VFTARYGLDVNVRLKRRVCFPDGLDTPNRTRAMFLQHTGCVDCEGYLCFPPQEHSGGPDGVITQLVCMFEIVNRTAHLAAFATATDTGTPIT